MIDIVKRKTWLREFLEIIGIILIIFIIRTVGFGLYQVPSGSMETTMLVGDRFFGDKFSYWLRAPRAGEVIAFNEPPACYQYAKSKLKNLFQHYVWSPWGPSSWTKRVVGVPGDEIRGVIEDGKPVIYVNSVKLHEPYLNKYPLIAVWKDDPEIVRLRIQKELQPLVLSGVSKDAITKVLEREERDFLSQKSYDTHVDFKAQPFYRIDPMRVDRNQDGSVNLLWPGTAIHAKRSTVEHIVPGENYWTGSDEFFVKLGHDEYWLMGDNRLGSKDSRFFGPIKRNFIHARIIFLIWSLDSDESWWIIDLLRHPVDFWKRIRWSRCLHWVT